MQRAASVLTLAAVSLSCASLPALAQQLPGGPQRPPAILQQDSSDARGTRAQLHQLFRQLPPAVGEVLSRDPSLLANEQYLAPYPTLQAFLQQHPEIARNPGFFLGGFSYFEPQPRNRALDILENVLGGFLVLFGGAAVLGMLVWLVRAIIDHRRWLRVSRVQTELQTKVMDRLTNNEDLLAYLQSPGGRRFLEGAPALGEGAVRPYGAPIGSILWSVQGGVVLISLGVGLWFVQGRVLEEVAEGFYIIGVIVTALGAGFVLSALVAYALSRRFGLTATQRADHA
jgi:hypothetical protein